LWPVTCGFAGWSGRSSVLVDDAAEDSCSPQRAVDRNHVWQAGPLTVVAAVGDLAFVAAFVVFFARGLTSHRTAGRAG